MTHPVVFFTSTQAAEADAMSPKRRKLFHFDSLERRDTPSAIVAAVHHPVHHGHKPPPVHHHTYHVNGTVNATLAAPPVIANGSATIASNATLVDAKLGTLTGPLTATFSLAGTAASAQGVFADSSGSKLVIDFAVNGSVSQGSFSGAFQVVAGTGRFAGATGSGTVTNGVLSVTSESLGFDLTGTVKV